MAAIASANLPHHHPRTLPVYDLATLSPEDTARLADRPALYRIALDSQAEEHDGRIAVDGVSEDTVYRSVRLLPGADEESKDRLTVRAKLQIIEHGLSWGYPSLREYRLLDAIEVP